MTTQAFHPFRSEQARAEFEAFYAERARAWPVACETRLIDTPSGRTFARVSGSRQDPPLVLLAGARGTSLMWIPNIAALSAHHRSYALDTINDIGLSVPWRDGWTPEALVGWLDEVLRVLVPRGKLSLMGMSYGGWLAALYARRFPERLDKLVLVAPGGTVLRLSFAFFVRVMMVLLRRRPGAKETALVRTLRWVFEDTVRSGEAGRAFVERDITELLRTARHFTLPRPVWPTVLDDAAWRSWSVPTLFLVGENEKIYSPGAAVKRLHRLAPVVRAEIVPGAGHDVTFAQPERLNRLVQEFLAESAPAPPLVVSASA
jgi:pimeloyl-ACP methyl ester carboxylesterase